MKANVSLMKVLVTFAIITLCAAMLIGCSACAVKSANHPNQINAFDGQAYDTLLVAQSSIESAKQQTALLESHPEAKDVLNKAIAAYNLAETSYKTYHAAGGGDTTQLSQQLLNVVTQVASVQKAFGSKL